MLRTAEENVALGHATTVEEATAVLSKLEDVAYTETPFRSRLEYVRAICAIIAKYPLDMGRRNAKGRKLGDVLRAATAPMAAEYLLNGMRYICRNRSMQVSPLPMGATGNEALHAELKNWFTNVNAFHVDRMDFTLGVFRMVKMLGFLAAARAPWTVGLRQGEMVHRVLGMLRRRGRHSFDFGASAPRLPETLRDMKKPQRGKPQSSAGARKRPRIAAPKGRRADTPYDGGRSRVCFNHK